MAIGFDASGDVLSRTSNVPSTTNFTICGWVLVRTVRSSAYQYFAGIDDGATQWILLGYNNGGTLELSYTGGGVSFPANPTTGQWFFFAVTCAGTGAGQLVGYFCHPGGPFVTASANGVSFVTSAALHIGNDGFDDYTDTVMAGVKVYDAVLSQAELAQEMYRFTPHRTANLNLFSPLWSAADLIDYSGNGNNPTSSGTLTSESGPPVGIMHPPVFVPSYLAISGPTTQTVSHKAWVALSSAGAATLEQEGFRWRNDDGSEAAATWAAAQDSNVTVAASTNIRLRVLLNATGDPAGTPYQLEYRKQGETTWKKVLNAG